MFAQSFKDTRLIRWIPFNGFVSILDFLSVHTVCGPASIIYVLKLRRQVTDLITDVKHGLMHGAFEPQ
ncbi:MAG: hypothetical protein ISS64_05440 [Desulfobacterales bacterium]|nr:hypothetical protein [Desulfobacterales bacterium]